jgi:hypothetical protein
MTIFPVAFQALNATPHTAFKEQLKLVIGFER